MVLQNVIAPAGRVFLKSEWGPISDDWPAVSFSKRSVGDRLRAEFNPERDVLLYVGTSGEHTRQPEHRRRLLSAVKIEPSRIYDTQQLVPASAWARAQQMFKDRWKLSMGVRHAWDVPSLPSAPDTVPETYRMLGWRQNWGNVVQVLPDERAALLDIALVPIVLALQPAGSSFDGQRAAINADKLLATAVGEMVAGIRERVERSGTESIRINPMRLAEGELYLILMKKWTNQNGRCALCEGDIELESDNKLLKCSADRIDSSLPWYNIANLQITHRACNWAKNDAPTDLFEEWLDVLRASMAPELGSI